MQLGKPKSLFLFTSTYPQQSAHSYLHLLTLCKLLVLSVRSGQYTSRGELMRGPQRTLVKLKLFISWLAKNNCETFSLGPCGSSMKTLLTWSSLCLDQLSPFPDTCQGLCVVCGGIKEYNLLTSPQWPMPSPTPPFQFLIFRLQVQGSAHL